MKVGQGNILTLNLKTKRARTLRRRSLPLPAQVPRNQFGILPRQAGFVRVARDQNDLKIAAESAQKFAHQHFRAALLHQRIFQSQSNASSAARSGVDH